MASSAPALALDGFQWPTQDANATRLLIPRMYIEQYGKERFQKDGSHCVLHYDPDQKVIQVLLREEGDGADAGMVLDSFSIFDMIGSKVEIEMNTPTTNTNKDEVAPLSPSQVSNEPNTALLSDTRGHANLSIFVYPKLDPSKMSLMNWCGATVYKPTPNGSTSGSSASTQPHATVATSPSKLKNRHAFFRAFPIAPLEDMGCVARLATALNTLARPYRAESAAPRQNETYLIIVNPMSGPKKNGKRVCDDTIVPMLEQASLEHDVLVTTHANHAAEYAAAVTDDSKDLSKYAAVLTVGGDGVFHEMMQGLRTRPDAQDLLHRLRFGVIPCGSANGLAMSIAVASGELCSPVDAMFMICKGRTCALDMSHYETQTQQYLSHLTLSWAIIANIDIDSEKLHYLGKLRFDLWGARLTIVNRTHDAKFSYLPVPEANSGDTPKINDSILPPLSEPVPSTWQTMEGPFVMFWATHVSHAAEKTHHAPHVKLQEGFFNILIVRGPVSRYRLARILIGLDDGSHANMDKVEWVKCYAYRLEPTKTDSYNDLDGEVVEPGPIQARIMPSTMHTFCNPTYL